LYMVDSCDKVRHTLHKPRSHTRDIRYHKPPKTRQVGNWTRAAFFSIKWKDRKNLRACPTAAVQCPCTVLFGEQAAEKHYETAWGLAECILPGHY
jgi:hypothetical protein